MGLGWQYRYRHEFIIFAVKGERKNRRISTRSQSDIIRIPRIHGNKTEHPTEKPIALMQELIRNSSEEGELVVDLFAGSGVVPAAAEEERRQWTAFEIDQKWYDHTKQRLGLL
ncbi:putative site-specific DNA-methyltransferase [Paenibacillus agaridevorans]|uniref:Putative site-specific DNA-methyltransferase n=1 Tax=Paenibacillus agaridevorans TaxID=171404 RepID=A0A2R5EXK2_9BACL|nr:putative site-specific DNA-methyltransferase [Paenibacillus agaridevorans]